jgi:hypothetical protein
MRTGRAGSVRESFEVGGREEAPEDDVAERPSDLSRLLARKKEGSRVTAESRLSLR